MRICLDCGSSRTRIDTTGRAKWFRHDGGYVCRKCHQRRKAREKGVKPRAILTGRICSKCGSTTTYVRSNGYAQWHHDKEGHIICKTCYNNSKNQSGIPGKPRKRCILDKKAYYKQFRARTIRFKGRSVLVDKPMRKGVCSRCGRSVAKGEIKRTHMHHLEYDENDPAAHTIELCVACHTAAHDHIGNRLIIIGPEVRRLLKEGKTVKEIAGLGFNLITVYQIAASIREQPKVKKITQIRQLLESGKTPYEIIKMGFKRGIVSHVARKMGVPTRSYVKKALRSTDN